MENIDKSNTPVLQYSNMTAILRNHYPCGTKCLNMSGSILDATALSLIDTKLQSNDYFSNR
jgi:hypothetical protein